MGDRKNVKREKSLLTEETGAFGLEVFPRVAKCMEINRSGNIGKPEPVKVMVVEVELPVAVTEDVVSGTTPTTRHGSVFVVKVAEYARATAESPVVVEPAFNTSGRLEPTTVRPADDIVVAPTATTATLNSAIGSSTT